MKLNDFDVPNWVLLENLERNINIMHWYVAEHIQEHLEREI